ncbi:MAG: type I-C CRISPR-associated protein Cas8c/Csd1 [Eubacteriales bacterium]|nr:type I-C CRISPR-associated protein Cas8c/Csd1 [Eubacteriales bacterium]
MGLMQMAVETYDNFEKEAGVIRENETPLAPVSHILTSAQLEIKINGEGKFLSGREVDKKEPKIIIPVTEESAGRTSAPCPHPLCEQIGYVAAYDEKKHGMYVEQLKEWSDFDSENKKLRAVLRYVEGGTVINDLLSEGILTVDEQGKPEKEKLMVRWRVECGEEKSACWEDRALFESFLRYYLVKREDEQKQLCMISGQEELPAKQHPKGIIPVNGNAKLISANDSSGFTYRGRFSEDWQAVTVGYITSQKAHNAISWMVANQGIRRAVRGSTKTEVTEADDRSYTVYGGRTFLCWNPHGRKVPQISQALLRKSKEKIVLFSDYKTSLEKVIDGYKTDMPKDARAVIAVFDAATTGRLSVTYYNELLLSDFLERLQYWDETCCWENGIYGIQSPPLYTIVRYACGTPREKEIAPPGDKLLRQQMERLISCRIDRSLVPRDMVEKLVHKASNLVLYNKTTRIQLLSVTCAMIRKFYKDIYKEDISMGLDVNNGDISYLFGRLLAVLEKVEEDTYRKAKRETSEKEEDNKEEKRETNAMRYQAAFVQRPLTTWGVLEKKLEPYYKKIKMVRPKSYDYYRGIVCDIAEKLPVDKRICNKKLEEQYLIGYYHQRKELYREKKNIESKQEE